MLKSIRLKNFKSFDNVEVPLSPLTLFLGPNGAGKTSLMQAILALRQSVMTAKPAALVLNGPLVKLGTGRDVLRQGADEEVIEIRLSTDNGTSGRFEFGYEADADLLKMRTPHIIFPELLTQNFTYLTAERIGPRLVNPRSLQAASSREMGNAGEGALAVLEFFRADILPEDDPRRSGSSGSLEEIFQKYLACICSTARIDIQSYGHVDSVGASYTFTPPNGLPSLPVRPTNVGFGLSYSLPIIVACLVAQPGGVLIIENPEAHLHTLSQRAMADLLYKTAAAGVQVVVESHSREFFHRYRNQAKANQIDGGKITINYIQATYEGGERVSRCSTLNTADADLTDWPQNFFDEYGSPVDLVAPV